MLGVGGLLMVRGTFAHILNGQRCDNDQHIREHAAAMGLDQHARHPRIHWYLGHFATGWSECQCRIGNLLSSALFLRGALAGTRLVRRRIDLLPNLPCGGAWCERAQFLQQRDTVANGPAVGCLHEGELLDIAEPQRGHLQDDSGQIGPQDLRFGERGPGFEIFLGIEADADAVGDAATAPRALARRGLRDLLDGKALHLGAHRIAGDARGAGIDDVTDAGDGQRCLGDIGGQHNPSSRVRGEYAMLFGRGQAGVERQDLGARKL